MEKIVTVIPIYRAFLDAFERYSLDHSLAVLVDQRTVVFIAPESLNRQYFSEHYPAVPFVSFADSCFASIAAYNRLLLSRSFYERFNQYEFLLILQTDAIVLRDDLNVWCSQPFDFVGAPWPDGYELFVNAGPFEGSHGKTVKVHVGNGGFSLRRVKKCISLLEEFAEIVQVFDHTGSSEDLFFSVMGALSTDFVIPNEITASLFSLELKPAYYVAVNGGRLPMGGHAWWKYEPQFWQKQLSDIPWLLPEHQ